MARYIATVHLVFEADSDAEAADAVSGMLTENLMHSTDEPGGKPPLIDWGYLHDGRRYCHATPLPEGTPEDLEGVDLTALAPAPKAMAASLQLTMALGILVTPRDKDQIAEYCEEYGKDPAEMTEDDLEEMESDLENDRVWSDALASYDFIRRAREIVKAIPYTHDEDTPLVPIEATVLLSPELRSDLPASVWEDHPDFPAADWKYEIENNDTRAGYRDWLKAKLEAASAPPAGP